MIGQMIPWIPFGNLILICRFTRMAKCKYTALDEERLWFGMKYLDTCSFRCYPATNCAVWCLHNEPKLGYKLRELYKDFGSVLTVAKAPFCWSFFAFQRLRCPDSWFAKWYRGLIRETNVTHIEVSVIRVKTYII